MGVGQGHLQMCRQVSMSLLHMHKGFSHLNEEADDHDVIIMMSLSHCLHKLTVVKRGSHISPRSSVLVWVLEGKATDSLSWLTGKCSLFVYLRHMCPRFSWMPWVSIFELLVCQLGGSSPCIHQTWYRKGKDHCHSEQNSTLGIHCNITVPTEISQHPHDIYMSWQPHPE